MIRFRVSNLAKQYSLCYSESLTNSDSVTHATVARSTKCKEIMKKNIHAKNYRSVIFLDTSSGEKFLIPSTIETEVTGKWEDGKTYPQYNIEISSASHPFYTGRDKVLDIAGRVEKFKARRAAAVKSPAKKKKKTSSKVK